MNRWAFRAAMILVAVLLPLVIALRLLRYGFEFFRYELGGYAEVWQALKKGEP